MRILENRPVVSVAIVYERATGKAVASYLQETDAIIHCQKLNRALVSDPIDGDELSLIIPDTYTWKMYKCAADSDGLTFDEIIPY